MTYPMLLAAALVAAVLAWAGSATVSLVVGLAVLALGLVAMAVLRRDPGTEAEADPSRRRFLGWMAIAGLLVVAGGTTVGRAVRRLTRPDPEPVIRGMAQDMGSEYMELVKRGFHEPTSGELQLLLAPGNSSNYAQESVSLIQNDPRTSHASVWMYLERVPLLVYAPGSVSPGVSEERVTLADIAPTTAKLIGFEDFPERTGRPLRELEAPAEPPKVVVTFVIDGGGWNVLDQWPDAWPNLRRLTGEGMLYTNALHGSFPAVTAAAHATIGTGAFPETHGISGHNLKVGGGHVRKAYGKLGQADPSDIRIPTLADLWTEHTGGRAFIGEIGYQIWHLGMIGAGGVDPLGNKPVAIYWDEPNYRWAPQNPELYRLPKVVPPDTTWRRDYEAYMAEHPDDFPPEQHGFAAKQTPACVPATVRYQGDVIEASFDSEDIGNHEVTDLVYINYKFPDYTGHIYNMLEPPEETILRAVDEQLGRLADMLGERFGRDFVLIVAADHGQCPNPSDVDGVRLDPLQLAADIEAEFGGDSVYPIVHEVAPSEVFLDKRGLLDSGATPADIAAWLKDYTYGENYHLYQGVPRDAVDWDKRNFTIFSGIMPAGFIEGLQSDPAEVSSFGPTKFPDADPGIARL